MSIGDIKSFLDLLDYCNKNPWTTIAILIIISMLLPMFISKTIDKKFKHYTQGFKEMVIDSVSAIIDLKICEINDEIRHIKKQQDNIDGRADEIIKKFEEKLENKLKPITLDEASKMINGL